MSSYRLMPREGTCTFHKILHGRKWVGRVYQHADGTWLGDISKRTLGKGSTPIAAFDQAVAKHLGFDSVQDLQEHNWKVRTNNKVKRDQAKVVLDQMLRGDYTAFDHIFGIK